MNHAKKTFFFAIPNAKLFNIITSEHVDNGVIKMTFFLFCTHLKNNENLIVTCWSWFNSVHIRSKIFFQEWYSNRFPKIFMTILLDLVQTHFYLFCLKEVMIALTFSTFSARISYLNSFSDKYFKLGRQC